MMRLPLLSLLLLSLACLPRPTLAQTTIHHCVASDGTPVFTDQPCASMGATKVSAAQADPFAPAPPTPPRACPKTLDTLKKRVTEAFQARNANALAGLMLWHGYGERGAVHTMRDLADLMQWPFLGVADAAPAPSRNAGLSPLLPTTAQADTSPPPSLTIKLGRPDQPETSFAIIKRAGCLWLEP